MHTYLKAVCKTCGRTWVSIVAQRVLAVFLKLTLMADHLYGPPQRPGQTRSRETHIVYTGHITVKSCSVHTGFFYCTMRTINNSNLHPRGNTAPL